MATSDRVRRFEGLCVYASRTLPPEDAHTATLALGLAKDLLRAGMDADAHLLSLRAHVREGMRRPSSRPPPHK